MKRFAATLLTLCWLSGVAPAQKLEVRLRPQRGADAGEQAPVADAERVAQLLLQKTNQLRRQQGLSTLATQSQLSRAASDFAKFMAADDKYGHTADGRDPEERIEAAGYDYCLVAENIAWRSSTAGFTSDELAQEFFDAWRHSPEHRENLLDPDLRQVGIAVGRSEKAGRYYAVQDFGRPISDQIVFAVANPTKTRLTYRTDEQDFVLEPRFSRQHRRCRPPTLAIADAESPSQPSIVFHPVGGERYIAVRDAAGRLTIEKSRLTAAEPKAAAGHDEKK